MFHTHVQPGPTVVKWRSCLVFIQGLGSYGQAVHCCHACVQVVHWYLWGKFLPVIHWQSPRVKIPFFFLHQGQTQPKVESLPYRNTKQSPTWALIIRLFLSKSKWDSVKMLKMRPHLGQYVTNLLVWICEIYCFSEEGSLQFPKIDGYLPVSLSVIHVIYLNFNSFPLVFQVLSHTTQQSLHYFVLHIIVPVFISSSFSRWMCLSVVFCL